MKILINSMILFLVMFFSTKNVIAQSAVEEFILWDNQVFTPTLPDTVYSGGDVIAISNEINNNNNFNSLTVLIAYKNMIPDEGTFLVMAVIEGNINDIWYPIGYQFRVARDTLTKLYVIKILPVDNVNEGSGVDIFVGNQNIAKISRNVGVVPDRFRVKILVGDFSGNIPLESITITGFGRKFNIN